MLRQLAARLGDDAFLGGVREHFELHRFGNATMHDLFASWERASGGSDLGGFVRDWLLTPGADQLRVDRAAGAVLRTSPASYPAERTHLLDIAVHRDGRWEVAPHRLEAASTPFDAGDAPVLLDATETTWAICPPDALTMDALPRLAPTMEDPRLRATMWNSVRLALFDGALTPTQVAELLVAAPPVEDTASSARGLLSWVGSTALPLAPDGTVERYHAAVLDALGRATPGSELQLSAFRHALLSSQDVDRLARWAAGDGLPDGITLDTDLRWRALTRLAGIGATDRAALDAALADEPSSAATVNHAAAVASLPTTEGKDFAWARATGEVSVPNYEIDAAGRAMWRIDQRALTQPYAEAYFADLDAIVAAHQGWVQGTVVTAYFPITHLDAATVAAGQAALRRDLPGAVRRRLADAVDELERRVAVLG